MAELDCSFGGWVVEWMVYIWGGSLIFLYHISIIIYLLLISSACSKNSKGWNRSQRRSWMTFCLLFCRCRYGSSGKGCSISFLFRGGAVSTLYLASCPSVSSIFWTAVFQSLWYVFLLAVSFWEMLLYTVIFSSSITGQLYSLSVFGSSWDAIS